MEIYLAQPTAGISRLKCIVGAGHDDVKRCQENVNSKAGRLQRAFFELKVISKKISKQRNAIQLGRSLLTHDFNKLIDEGLFRFDFWHHSIKFAPQPLLADPLADDVIIFDVIAQSPIG